MTYHIPVLLKECLEYLDLKENGIYVDATLGGGGHTEAIRTSPLSSPSPSFASLQKASENSFPSPSSMERGVNEKSLNYRQNGVRIIGFDQDEEAIAAAKDRLNDFDNIVYIQDNFSNLKKHIQEPVDGILFDLGVSSHQIDTGERGFSINQNGPLDMRMDKNIQTSAENMINLYHEHELEKIFKEFGEERFSHRIAKAIGRKRSINPIKTTFELKEIVENAIPTWKKRESVSRIFQALRIAVNNELEVLQNALLSAIELLKPGGRIVVMSYHSLEDRITKHTFLEAKQATQLQILTKRPVMAGPEEIAINGRSRSAKLRAGQKL